MSTDEAKRVNEIVVELGWVRRAMARIKERLDRPTLESAQASVKEVNEYLPTLDRAIAQLRSIAQSAEASSRLG